MKSSKTNNLRYENLLFPRNNQPLWVCEDLDLYISVMSEMQSDGNFRAQKLSQGIVFHVIHNGCGVMECDNVKYEVKKGDLFLFWPNAHVKYHDSPQTPWKYTWFWLAGTKAAMILGNLGFHPNTPIYDIANFDHFHNALNTIAETFKQGEHSIFYSIAAAWNIVDALKNDLYDQKSKPLLDNIANSCRILIENDPARFAVVGDLAKHFNVERSTLFRIFKNAFNVSPKKYIEKMRFEKACQLLSSTDMRIKQIANICGFDNQCYFSAVFQKRSGSSPSKWRKITRKS